MTKRLALWVCLLLPFCFYSQVVINEVDADTPGLDVLEIIELTEKLEAIAEMPK